MNHVTLPLGCYIDGTHGIYAPRRLCMIAYEYGWSGGVPTDEQCRSESDFAMEMAEEAEAWLNENVAEDGNAFGWFDGCFFYWSEQDWLEAFGEY